MKKYIFLALLLVASATQAQQSYADSSITLTLTQTAAYWVGVHARANFEWKERMSPSIIGPFISNGTNPDSVFMVTIKASWILGAVERLISQPLALVLTDYNKILLNQPAIPGYTALGTQIGNKAANPNDPQRFCAAWLLTMYQNRITDYTNLYNSEKATIVSWGKN